MIKVIILLSVYTRYSTTKFQNKSDFQVNVISTLINTLSLSLIIIIHEINNTKIHMKNYKYILNIEKILSNTTNILMTIFKN